MLEKLNREFYTEAVLWSARDLSLGVCANIISYSSTFIRLFSYNRIQQILAALSQLDKAEAAAGTERVLVSFKH